MGQKLSILDLINLPQSLLQQAILTPQIRKPKFKEVKFTMQVAKPRFKFRSL